jgi:uncharacterized protein
MTLMIFWYSGIIIGLLSGLVGIGGGTILLPLLVNLGYSPAQGVATSSLAIVLTAFSSCWRNWQNDGFDIERISFLATPAIATAPIGVFLSTNLVILAANMFWQAGFTYGSSVVNTNMGCTGLNRLGG